MLMQACVRVLKELCAFRRRHRLARHIWHNGPPPPPPPSPLVRSVRVHVRVFRHFQMLYIHHACRSSSTSWGTSARTSTNFSQYSPATLDSGSRACTSSTSSTQASRPGFPGRCTATLCFSSPSSRSPSPSWSCSATFLQSQPLLVDAPALWHHGDRTVKHGLGRGPIKLCLCTLM